MTTEMREIEPPVPVSLTALLTGLLVSTMGCNPGPSFECQPRTLETQEFSSELFVGTWSSCPYPQIDYHGASEIPSAIYCTFHDDGSLTLREQYSSGFSRDTTTTWDVDVEQRTLHQYDEDSDLIESFDQVEISEDSIELVGGNSGRGVWNALSCGGPDW